MHTRTLMIMMFSVAACASATKPQAIASIAPLQNGDIRGELSFTDTKDGVLIQGTLSGLPPHSSHGFHVHEVGDCSSPEAPKGHFNPHVETHGALFEHASHVGDLGNVFADGDGVAKISVIKEGARVKKGETAFLGHSVVVHEGQDNLETQPSGDSGKPAACGVIKTRGETKPN
jgi:superoxide dismutase, Cu-Zn family